MEPSTVLVLVLVAGLIAGGALLWRGPARPPRPKLSGLPFPEAWRELLDERVPLVRRLTEVDRLELERRVLAFLDDKHFEGHAGLTLDDTVRVVVAAQACLLVLRHDGPDYPGLHTIRVYPRAFVAPTVEPIGGGLVVQGHAAHLGQAFRDGTIVLAWDDVLRGTADPDDGHNVVLHEFAHALDHEDGAGDGAPVLAQRARYVAWARVLGAAFAQLREDVADGLPGVLRAYGAKNPAEFFAVATEVFFERPERLKRRHPELYAELSRYYRQDPEALGR